MSVSDLTKLMVKGAQMPYHFTIKGAEHVNLQLTASSTVFLESVLAISKCP